MSATINHIRIHHFQPTSLSNGPGWRAVIWFQGCTLGCPGCFNPETHAHNQGRRILVTDLADQILDRAFFIEGITISGGEPIQQLLGLISFLSIIRSKSNLSILLFTGYTWQEFQKMPSADRLQSLVDVMIAGRYNASQRIARGLVGSSNKSIHFFTDRYTKSDLETVPEAEVILTQNGEIIFSGINPPQWIK